MKKSLMAVLAVAATSVALAGQDNMLATFSTRGPDCYADGTVVKDGECYALVWTHTNAVFQGITVTGEAVGSQEENRVLCIAPLAKDGHCREVVVEVNKVLADLYAGVDSGVNGFSAAQEFTLSASEQIQSVSATNVELAATASILPASIPQPKIKSIEVKDGIVRLTVARTSKLVRYGVSSGATPATLAADPDFAPQDGDDAGDIVIEAPAKGNSGFFSVGRAPLK